MTAKKKKNSKIRMEETVKSNIACSDGDVKTAENVHEIKTVNPLIILAVIIVLAAIATFIIPAGTFDRIPIEGTDYETVVPDSYHLVEKKTIEVFDVFVSVTKGLQEASGIIFFLLILGGTIRIVEATGALHAGINNMMRRIAGKEIILVPVCLTVFSLISATTGCCEEYLAFLPLMYMICMTCGFDSVMAVALIFCAAAVGFGGGMTNVFTVGVAQTIAGLPMYSGIEFRILVWAVLLTATVIYMMIYARKIQKYPEKAINFETDRKFRKYTDLSSLSDIKAMTGWQKAVLVVFFGGFAFCAFGVIRWGLNIDEMSAIFIIAGLLSAFIGRVGVNKAADAFIAGASDMVWGGFVIGMCYAAVGILRDSNIMDTLVNTMGRLLSGTHTAFAACGMYVLQDLLNILIPSGSGQAAITMPFMAQLSDILGVSRQTAVLAFQLGDAFTNAVAFTSGELMAALAICHVPWSKWFKFVWKLWIIWSVIAMIMLVIACMVGYS